MVAQKSSGFGTEITTAELQGKSMFQIIIFPCIICCIAFFFDKKPWNIIGCIFAFIQFFLAALMPAIRQFFDNWIGSIGYDIDSHYYSFSSMGILVVFLSVLLVVASITITIVNAKKADKMMDDLK